jgi:hypothetical protein
MFKCNVGLHARSMRLSTARRVGLYSQSGIYRVSFPGGGSRIKYIDFVGILASMIAKEKSRPTMNQYVPN